MNAIIVAAGQSRRFGSPKLWAQLLGRPALAWTLDAFAASEVGDVVLVVRAEDRVAAAALSFRGRPPRIATGGASRGASVQSGLAVLPEGDGAVLVHDGARCLVRPELIHRVMAAKGEAVIPAVAVADTLKRVRAGRVVETVDRDGLYLIQTPQRFSRRLLMRAYEQGGPATDDAGLVEALGEAVHTVEGDPENFKITYPRDLRRAEQVLARRAGGAAWPRVGYGYDVHRTVEGGRLRLCGVDVPAPFGLEGHSDGDVALHALMDAALGAAGLADIGHLFPPDDPATEGIDSRHLVSRTLEAVAAQGLHVAQLDVTILAERPKLAPFREQMCRTLSELFGVPPGLVGLKATTGEGLGFVGKARGIVAHAIVTLVPEVGP